MFPGSPVADPVGAAAGGSRQRRNSKGLRQSAHQQVVSDAWLPNSDMISVRVPAQKGHGGASGSDGEGEFDATAPLLHEQRAVAVAARALHRFFGRRRGPGAPAE
ncbi:MAG: hypothetical protein OXI83_06085, partial [Gemmatimonadota bacterium]|nr:hypothetical protein [Gemmatimonadota bacterium]